MQEETFWGANFSSLTIDISDVNTKKHYMKWFKGCKNDFSIRTGCGLQNELKTAGLKQSLKDDEQWYMALMHY